MKKEFVTVGVDGSVYRFHPTFKDLLDSKIDELVDGKYEVRRNFINKIVYFQFILVLSEDGSGKGAAVAAAVATRMSRITLEHITNMEGAKALEIAKNGSGKDQPSQPSKNS
jgi:hexokinase